MMLEAAQYKDNCFVTLTYSPEKLPEDMCVWPREIQLFIKRHRKKAAKPFRYFAVGEYGEKSGLPHYHLALFDHPGCLFTQTRRKRDGVCCAVCSAVSESWGQGFILLGTLEQRSMAYVAGYINKKMTKASDPRLEGRAPEFARMSLKPGIGHGMMHDLASTLMEHGLEKRLVDVPVCLQHGPTQYPLGRYLRRSLRHLIGRPKNAPQGAIDEYKEKMRPLREIAFAGSTSLQTEVLKASEGKRIQIVSRAKLKRKRHTI